MSTYGGDSWVPEAKHRKQLVDHLLADVHIDDSSQLRRLSNGRIACLVCPHRPVLDTFPMLIMHRKGARHQAAAVKLQEREFRLQNEIQKRTALKAAAASASSGSSWNQQSSSSAPACSPLVEATRKRTAQALSMTHVSQATCESGDAPNRKQKTGRDEPFFSCTPPKNSDCPVKLIEASETQGSGRDNRPQQEHAIAMPSPPQVGVKEDSNWRKERERQLRLREAGWRLDGNGRWFREENVEFDSDEEAPDDL